MLRAMDEDLDLVIVFESGSGALVAVARALLGPVRFLVERRHAADAAAVLRDVTPARHDPPVPRRWVSFRASMRGDT